MCGGGVYQCESKTGDVARVVVGRVMGVVELGGGCQMIDDLIPAAEVHLKMEYIVWLALNP
ncbi:hypothetical protein GV64_20960 [Endozoicomonas elysicola]|uniref:Uncharacterized protein n=1 Tax=Endozoicomonas elysicola TaxID=305900 RepID=A0A081KFD5_9GAMM|nr:hypothetical protein GV64_20960 [Endozoicomonas elysicola]